MPQLHTNLHASTRFVLMLCIALWLLAAWSMPALAATTEISFYYPVAAGGKATTLIEDFVADFSRENPDIKVTPIYAGTYKESITKALTAHKSGTPPTVAVLFAVDMFTLIDADAIVAYEDLIPPGEDRAWLSDFYPALMTNSRAANKTWGIPFQRSTILLYWNKRMFADAGLDPVRPPANWKEMLDFARSLTRRNADGQTTCWGLQIPSSGFPYWLLQGLATANGAELMNAAGTVTRFNDPAVVEALQYWVDLSRVHKVHPPGVVEWGATPNDFFKGKAAMIWTTSGNLGNVKANAPFDFGVAALPANKHGGSPTGGGNLYIFKKSTPQQQQAALRFVRWLAQPEQTARWSINSGYIATRPLAWTTPAMMRYIADFPMSTVARDQLSHAVAELSTHENQLVTRALNRGLTDALTGTKTPAQAMADAQSEAERILLPYQR